MQVYDRQHLLAAILTIVAPRLFANAVDAIYIAAPRLQTTLLTASPFESRLDDAINIISGRFGLRSQIIIYFKPFINYFMFILFLSLFGELENLLI